MNKNTPSGLLVRDVLDKWDMQTVVVEDKIAREEDISFEEAEYLERLPLFNSSFSKDTTIEEFYSYILEAYKRNMRDVKILFDYETTRLVLKFKLILDFIKKNFTYTSLDYDFLTESEYEEVKDIELNNPNYIPKVLWNLYFSFINSFSNDYRISFEYSQVQVESIFFWGLFSKINKELMVVSKNGFEKLLKSASSVKRFDNKRYMLKIEQGSKEVLLVLNAYQDVYVCTAYIYSEGGVIRRHLFVNNSFEYWQENEGFSYELLKEEIENYLTVEKGLEVNSFGNFVYSQKPHDKPVTLEMDLLNADYETLGDNFFLSLSTIKFVEIE